MQNNSNCSTKSDVKS
uniref:Uncharacterized protein n=1 Tax=Anguilla anguilla TaxID=7936 RepID=A0A0E9PAV5_ANGAN